MVFGTFDGLHPGHLDFFKQAKDYGDYLTVVIGRDKNVLKIKGKLPKHSEANRLEKVVGCGLADRVIMGQIRDVYKIIRQEKPEVIALGYDQESYTYKLANEFPNIKIIRLKPFKPEIYKSSKLNK